MSTTTTILDAEKELAKRVRSFRNDPRGFVLNLFPWGKPGFLENHPGPDVWQDDFLRRLGEQVSQRNFTRRGPVMPIKDGVSSGHGIGKSVLIAMIFWWIMSTRPDAQGTVTANTFTQLETKTWAAIRKWGKHCITGHWFNIGSDKVTHKAHPESWFASAQSCKEENSEAFAGQHAEQSTSFYMFDEASAIPTKIYEVAEGGLTDGEPMWFIFGNPTRNNGAFHSACFGADRKYWDSRCIDSRECRFSNKALISEWLEKYGEDSDWFRVRVRGLPPRASDTQFIDSERIVGAQKRQVSVLQDEPLVMGIDLARGGDDDSVLRFRRGLDARTIPPVVITGERSKDSTFIITLISREITEKRVDYTFCDETGASVGGPMGDRLRQLGFKVIPVQYGGASPDPHYANMRAYMWAKLRDWLPRGGIEAPKSGSISDTGTQLETDLCGPGYHPDRLDRLCLESKEDMKKRGVASPNHGDALASTFAQDVALKRSAPSQYISRRPTTAWS